MWEDLTRTGYSKEEEYFDRLNHELAEERRRNLDTARSERKTREEKALHWMRCPKCGDQLDEVRTSGICVDQCRSCHGTYFDEGELDALLATEGIRSALRALWLRIRRKAATADPGWKP